MSDIGRKKQSEREKDQRIAELEHELRIISDELAKRADELVKRTRREALLSFENQMGRELGAMSLDTQLCIKSATPFMQKTFNLIPSDTGRPITDLASSSLYASMEHDAKQVIATSVLKEITVQSKDGRWFNMRFLPHLDGSVVDGVVVSLIEKTEDQSRDQANGDKLLSSIEKSPIVVWHQDMSLRYTWIHNPHPGFAPKEVIGKTDEDLLPPADAANLITIKRGVLETGQGVRRNVKTIINGKCYYYDLVVEPLLDMISNVVGVSCVSMEISENTYAQGSGANKALQLTSR